MYYVTEKRGKIAEKEPFWARRENPELALSGGKWKRLSRLLDNLTMDLDFTLKRPEDQIFTNQVYRQMSKFPVAWTAFLA